MKRQRDRGTGSLYQKPGSSNWHIQYYINGVRQRESTGTDNKTQAKKMLQDRMSAANAGNFIGAQIDRITVEEIVTDFLNSPKKKESKSWHDDNDRWENHIKDALGHVRASRLSTSLLNVYINTRRKQRITMQVRDGKTLVPREINKYPSNGTINRELSLLRASFNYARRSTPPKVSMIPVFELLPESKPRNGFLRDEEYDALANECSKAGLWIRTIFELYYTFGWRKSEVIRHLRVSQCDLTAGVLWLNVGDTKNKQGRNVVLTQKLKQLLAACAEGKKQDAYLITRDGKPINDFRKTWESICTEANVPGLHIHDLRRTGARNMRRMGIHESVIMKIGGWKTRSVFDRYNIVDNSDIRDAVRKMDERDAERESQQLTQPLGRSEVDSHSSATVAVKSAEANTATKRS